MAYFLIVLGVPMFHMIEEGIALTHRGGREVPDLMGWVKMKNTHNDLKHSKM